MTELFISEISLKPHIADYSRYPFCLPVVRHLGTLKLRKRVTFFAGENGTGKSTLLEAIAVAFGFNPEGGSRNFNFATKETHSALYEHLRLVKGLRPKDGYFLRAESFYNVASEVDRLDGEPSFDDALRDTYGGRSLHEQSHGESFMSLIQNRFFGAGLYLLDEPEAALSPARQLALICEIDRLAKEDSQFIICTHSPILMAFPDTDIYYLTQDAVKLTPYKETEHYLISRQFLNNPEGVLRHLLG